MSLKEFFKYLQELDTVEDRLVYIRYKYACDDSWTYSNEVLAVDFNVEGNYFWFNDWNEGQEDVEVLGCIPINDIAVPENMKNLKKENQTMTS